MSKYVSLFIAKFDIMTFPQNSTRLNLLKRTVCFIIASMFTVTTYSQQDIKSEEWLAIITNKHDIKYDSYTLHGEHFIIGEKRNDGELETFKAAIVITKGLGGYWIFRSERVSYDPNTTELTIDDCTMEKFKQDSNSFEPEISEKHINVSVNLTEQTSTMFYANQNHNK
jgi:hypothetical protein